MAAECIAPANPGGGWDFTCRQIGKIMFDIGAVDKPVQVTNMAGAGGGLAYNHVVAERGEDEDLFVAASSATTTRLAQNAYAGMKADQVRWVGAIGADPGVIVVGKDSEFQSLTDLVDAAKADPKSVAFAGGSAVGGFDHLKPLMVLQTAGVDRRDQGPLYRHQWRRRRHHPDGGWLHPGDVGRHVRGGGLHQVGRRARAVAVLTDERVPGFDDIPTAKEQGVDVVAVNWRGLYVPKGVSDETFDMWADRLAKVAESDEWAEAMAANGLAPFTKVGGDFQSYVDQVVADVESALSASSELSSNGL